MGSPFIIAHVSYKGWKEYWKHTAVLALPFHTRSLSNNLLLFCYMNLCSCALKKCWTLSFGVLFFQPPFYCGKVTSTEHFPISSLFYQLYFLTLFIVANVRVLVPWAASVMHWGLLQKFWRLRLTRTLWRTAGELEHRHQYNLAMLCMWDETDAEQFLVCCSQLGLCHLQSEW